ncbi:MAG: hypothetical protein O2895_04805, partial [Chloroflexi bacterium]|nr:hypothetical protein [Chloroflexota bacterium]
RGDAGDVGYLREAYHGGPYATHVLMPEAFAAAPGIDSDRSGGVRIPSATLRERLDEACDVAIVRARAVYGQRLTRESPEVRARAELGVLAERLEREGREPRVLASY